MSLNVNKCTVLSYTKSKNPITYNYVLNNAPVPRRTLIKDLGITFDIKLNFNNHVSNLVIFALKMLGFVIRTCKEFTNLSVLKTLYFTFIRSKLEFCTLIWFPIYNKQKLALELVERKFLKYLNYKSTGVWPP
ncbi:hypothetical protein BDFB_011205 [Asbolus verrucosus]|uniref:RVT 1 domain containing protein n=1 Tax=Asbolus verrucosus TaxID=1661398 RepID=A0A482W4L2_ASBVE|nr:hypothetical protein BDFB_011205 [Asbolus verrucosus]